MEDISLKPEAVYQQIKTELNQIVNFLKNDKYGDDDKQVRTNAIKTLSQFQSALEKELSELQEHAEWDRFTIAFYGETGVGKSTLIETLRILLNEPSKVKQRLQFAEILEQLEHTRSIITQFETNIQAAEEEVRTIEHQLEVSRSEFSVQQSDIQSSIDANCLAKAQSQEQLLATLKDQEKLAEEVGEQLLELERYLVNYEKSASFWARIKGFFVSLPQKENFGKVKQQFTQLVNKKTELSAQLQLIDTQYQQKEVALQLRLMQLQLDCENFCKEFREKEVLAIQLRNDLEATLKEKLTQQQTLVQQLSDFSDGEIIGVGYSDTTKNTQSYHFSHADKDFTLLDVPGIEGKESVVINEIQSAIKKAHAVFVLTNKPTAHQKGDDNTIGTLEKIKNHLGAQTEVWSIYNKKITNPKHSLKNTPLLNENELSSIHMDDAGGLDASMREQLGGAYRETIALAALPAFLASTNNFTTDSQNAKRRLKIMEDFTVKELLESSGVASFIEFLGGNFVKDTKYRILKSNFNKANSALNDVLSQLGTIKKSFTQLSKDLVARESAAVLQLRGSYQSLNQGVATRSSELIQKFANDARKKISQEIDKDLSNDEFKAVLVTVLTQQKQALQEEFPGTLDKEITRFVEDVKKVMERFTEQAQELTSVYLGLEGALASYNFDFNFNLDNGVKVGSLLVTLGGAIALLLGSGGWVLAVGLAGLVFSLGKSVWGALDSDFKKAEQRKSMNQNIAKTVRALEERLEEGLDKIKSETIQKIEVLEELMHKPIRETQALIEIFDFSTEQLTLTSQKIMHQGGL